MDSSTTVTQCVNCRQTSTYEPGEKEQLCRFCRQVRIRVERWVKRSRKQMTMQLCRECVKRDDGRLCQHCTDVNDKIMRRAKRDRQEENTPHGRALRKVLRR